MKTTITINGTTKEIELTEEQAKQFEKPKVWRPAFGDKYSYLNSAGDICVATWINHKIDIYCFNTNNCKQTVEECEFKREQELVIGELKNYAEEHNKPIVWGDDFQPKYSIVWDFYNDEIACVRSNDYIKHRDVYFSSVEIAKAAVKAVGEDRVKKYYLGVE